MVLLAIPIMLTACGDLPEPFLGNPGAAARRLAVPVAPMLAVPTPTHASLTPQAGADFADLLALSLQREEVPTLARQPEKTDWRLGVSAALKGDTVVPHYAILDPSGHEQGAIDGAAVPAAGWTAGAPLVLGQAAQDAVPKVLALMMSIRATRDRANPNSLLNRPAVLYVPEVTGAPGDGDPALTRLMRARLVEFGPLVQITPDGADFTVTGKVVVSPLPKGQQQVEIAWTVTRPSGMVVGKVSQLNSVPAGSLDGVWGDVATVVAQEASGGINEVVQRFVGRDEAKPQVAAAPAAGSAASPAAAAATGNGPAAHDGTAVGAAPAPGNTSGTVPGSGATSQIRSGQAPGESKAVAPQSAAVPNHATVAGGSPGNAIGPGGGTSSGKGPAASGKTGTGQGNTAKAKPAASTNNQATTPGKPGVKSKGTSPGKRLPVKQPNSHDKGNGASQSATPGGG